MDRLESIRTNGYKGCRKGDFDYLISGMERLEKEKEWMLDKLAWDEVLEQNCKTAKSGRTKVLKEMQQALKEG